MERFYFWPSSPALSLLALWVLTNLFFYAARVPMHRALRSFGRALSGGLRIGARWCKGAAAALRERDRELVLASGAADVDHKVSKELRRIEGSFTKELASYPALHRQMHDLVTRLDADYTECGVAPPSPPGLSDAVKAVAAMPRDGDRTVQKLLEEIQKSAVNGEKKALEAHREATAKRHKILAAMAGAWKGLTRLLDDTGKSVQGALESTRRIDGYMKQWEEVRGASPTAARALGWHQTQLFLVSLIVMAVALGGAFVNFQLIALPMSELVPSGSRLLGVPVSTIAALVIVLMEVAAGVFLMDALGITSMFPKMELLPASRRRLILGISFFGLFMLASIESSLAVLREQIVEADSALKASLAGTEVGGAAASKVPVIGQAVLGFILPWILAMVAIPLEMLIGSAGHVGLSAGSGFLGIAGAFTRVVGSMLRYLVEAVRWAYDVYIIIPLQIERAVMRRPALAPVRPLSSDRPLSNPVDEDDDGDGEMDEISGKRGTRRSIEVAESRRIVR